MTSTKLTTIACTLRAPATELARIGAAQNEVCRTLSIGLYLGGHLKTRLIDTSKPANT